MIVTQNISGDIVHLLFTMRELITVYQQCSVPYRFFVIYSEPLRYTTVARLSLFSDSCDTINHTVLRLTSTHEVNSKMHTQE